MRWLYVCEQAGDREDLVECGGGIVFEQLAVREISGWRLMHQGSECLRANVMASGRGPTNSDSDELGDDGGNISRTSHLLSYTAL